MTQIFFIHRTVEKPEVLEQKQESLSAPPPPPPLPPVQNVAQPTVVIKTPPGAKVVLPEGAAPPLPTASQVVAAAANTLPSSQDVVDTASSVYSRIKEGLSDTLEYTAHTIQHGAEVVMGGLSNVKDKVRFRFVFQTFNFLTNFIFERWYMPLRLSLPL